MLAFLPVKKNAVILHNNITREVEEYWNTQDPDTLFRKHNSFAPPYEICIVRIF